MLTCKDFKILAKKCYISIKLKKTSQLKKITYIQGFTSNGIPELPKNIYTMKNGNTLKTRTSEIKKDKNNIENSNHAMLFTYMGNKAGRFRGDGVL